MIVLSSYGKIGGHVVCVGHPATSNELDGMYSYRHEVYTDKGYIERTPSGRDIDIHDQRGSCTYFIAVDAGGGGIIGSARIIQEDPLPTEAGYFEYDEPAALAAVPRAARFEIGRLISTGGARGLPRGLILACLFDTITDWARGCGLQGGVSSIKSSALKRIAAAGIPVIEIPGARCVFREGSGDPLVRFFAEASNPVRPIAFLVSEVSERMAQLRSTLLRRRSDCPSVPS